MIVPTSRIMYAQAIIRGLFYAWFMFVPLGHMLSESQELSDFLVAAAAFSAAMFLPLAISIPDCINGEQEEQ